MAKAFKRRNYLPKKGFQTRLIVSFLLASLLANVIAVTLFIFLARKNIESLLFTMRMPATNVGALLTQAALLAGLVAVIALILLLLLTSRSMYVRTAHALHHIRTDLKKIGGGDLSSGARLRERGRFRDFAVEINAMAGELNRRFAGLKEQADELARAAEAGRATPEEGLSRAGIPDLRRAVKSLQERIGAFRI